MVNPIYLKLNTLYVALYSALACFFPFLTLYLQQKGLSFAEIGICYAIIWVVAITTQPAWGFLTDKYSNKRTILIGLMIVCSILILNFIFANQFIFILLSIFLLVIFQNSISPITDAYCYDLINYYKNLQFGKIRLMGSLGWAVASLIVGYIIKLYGINSAFYLYSACMLLTAALVYSFTFSGNTSKKIIRVHDMVNLLKDRRFLLFMFSLILVNIAWGSHSSYLPVLISQTGGDVSQLGITHFIIALSELPIFFYGTMLVRKCGELNLYIFGVAMLIVRFYLNSIFTSYEIIILIQFLQSITFTFYLLATIEYVNLISPAPIRTSAMTVYASACGMGQFIGNLVSGMLLESISIFSLYQLLSFMCALGLLTIIALKHVDKNYPKKEQAVQQNIAVEVNKN